MTAPLTAWSYSRYACWELCPLKFKLQFLDKLSKPTSKAMERGDKIHKAIAAYLMTPPDSMVLASTYLSEAFAHPFPSKLINEVRACDNKVVEQKWGFTRRWGPTGWFGKDTWFRSTLDAAVLYDDMWADVLDWKTGKQYDSNRDQMELNAISLMQHMKPATGTTTRMVYVDTGHEDVMDFKRQELPMLVDKWEHKAAQMFADDIWAPRPNSKCGFCDFSKGKGGQCRFG